MKTGVHFLKNNKVIFFKVLQQILKPKYVRFEVLTMVIIGTTVLGIECRLKTLPSLSMHVSSTSTVASVTRN